LRHPNFSDTTVKMDDLDMTFYDDKIWFVVKWGLPMVCRNVDGAVITFKINDIKSILNK